MLATHSAHGDLVLKTRFIIRRLIFLVFVMFGVTVITFVISHLVPADPARYAAGLEATPAQVEQLRQEMGLDRPPTEQFLRYLGGLLRGDMGRSIASRQPVLEDLRVFFPATLELVVLAFFLMVAIGIPVGILSSINQGKLSDYLTRIPVIAGTGIPIFWLALMGQLVFYYMLGWFPFGGRLDRLSVAPPTVTGFYSIDSLLNGDIPLFFETIRHLFMPAMALAIGRAAIITRLTRASMLEVLNQDFIRTAHSKGLHPFYIINRHALKVSFIPVLTELGMQLGWLLAGTVVVESIFAWPGIGRYAFTAIQYHDLSAIMGVTLVLAFFKVMFNLVVDISYAFLDPRITY